MDTSSSFKSRVMPILPVLVPLILAIWTGIAGVDFGTHWDEKIHRDTLKHAINHETLLPGFYRYPSLCFDLCCLSMAPEFITELKIGELKGQPFKECLPVLVKHVYTDGFVLRARTIFLLLSSLGILWVYLLVWTWRKSRLEALAAAAFLAFSWEAAYHSRWIAPDALMMQFGALTMFCSVTALIRSQGRSWLIAAAIAAGLATGTKYTSGLLLLPVCAAAYQHWLKSEKNFRLSSLLLQIGLLFCITYLITTPGTLLSPTRFIRDIRLELMHYQEGHFGFTVEAGLTHLFKNLRYLGGSLFSHFTIAALVTTSLSLVGAVVLVRESRSLGALYLCFPVLFLLYMSMQKVMFVRNLLVLTPFLAVCAARGVAFLWAASRLWFLRIPLAAGIAALLVVNGAWLVYAAGTIEDRGTTRFLDEAMEYIDAHPDTRFFISPKVKTLFLHRKESEFQGLKERPNVTLLSMDDADLVLLVPHDVMHPDDWPSNRPGTLITWFGPCEVNFEYYCSWLEPRVLLMTKEEARDVGMGG